MRPVFLDANQCLALRADELELTDKLLLWIAGSIVGVFFSL